MTQSAPPSAVTPKAGQAVLIQCTWTTPVRSEQAGPRLGYRRGASSEVWWDVAPAEVSHDDVTTQAREEYELGREQQRYYG